MRGRKRGSEDDEDGEEYNVEGAIIAGAAEEAPWKVGCGEEISEEVNARSSTRKDARNLGCSIAEACRIPLDKSMAMGDSALPTKQSCRDFG